ncbi:MAG: hypothetical protein GH155_03500 [Spirochaeta sp.]|nr:hypothetical protein [Spirochaeta sp.]
MIHFRQLKNGTSAILETVENTDIVSVGFWYRHGSRDETASERGFAHFLEHMLFKGTEKRTAFQIAQVIDRVGGFLNAFTEKELTCLFCTLPREYIELAIEVITDMVNNSVLITEDIEKEKLVVISEIKSIEDNPEERAYELYLETMWKGHPLSRRITGESKNIKKINRENLYAFYKKCFVPSNSVVTVAGKFDPEAVFDLLEKYRNNSTSNRLEQIRTPPVNETAWKFKKNNSHQVYIYTGLSTAPPHKLEDHYKILFFSTIFGESMSSRLFQQLREKEGLCYSVFSFRTYYSDTNLWSIYANTVPDLASRVIKSIDHELKRLHSEPPTEKEVSDAKGQLRGNLILSKEDMESRMKRLLRQYIITGKVLEHEESLSLLKKVTAVDMQEIVKQFIKSDLFSMLAYGNKRLKKYSPGGFNFG